MSIPESQLETWSHQGAEATAKATHESIRTALKKYNWPRDVRFDDYLQGSYRNATNIRGDSDVDLVAELTSTFRPEISRLSAPEKQRYEQRYGTEATYNWVNFRSDMLQALRDYYGYSAVSEGKKSLKVEASSGRLPADVVVCMKYRKFLSFPVSGEPQTIEGMTFWVPTEDRWVINYPKIHHANGTRKQSATSNRYKRTVRMFKNARSYMVQRGLFGDGVAPSYFLECFVYNMPDSRFDNSLQQTYVNALSSFTTAFEEGGYQSYLCQNGQDLLFGDQPEQWRVDNAFALLKALIRLWEDWT